MRNEFTAIIERDGDWRIACRPQIPWGQRAGPHYSGGSSQSGGSHIADSGSRREDALRGMPREAIREVVIEKSGK